MSTHIKPITETLKLEESMSDFLIVKAGSNEDGVLIAKNGEKPYGVAQIESQMNPPVQGDAVEVVTYAGGFVRLGATCSRGASISADADGKAKTATTGEWAVGVLDQGGVAGDIVGFRTFIHQLN